MNTQVANTIVQQLGGRRMQVMTGVKQFVATSDSLGVRFRLNRKIYDIRLNDNDLYDIKQLHLKRTTCDEVVDESACDVFVGELVSTLERMSGYHFTL